MLLPILNITAHVSMVIFFHATWLGAVLKGQPLLASFAAGAMVLQWLVIAVAVAEWRGWI